MRAALERVRIGPGAASALIVAVGLLVLLPYLLAGPAHFLDDWFALRNARLDAWWNAAGTDQWRARPGAGVVYALSFGLIGARPGIHVALAAVVLIAVAVILHRVLRRFLPEAIAVAVAVLWVVVPNHTSLETWPSALNIALALLLLVVAAERLTARRPSIWSDALAAVVLGSSVLCYEATAPAGALIVIGVAYDARRDRPRAWRVLGMCGTVLAGAGLWIVLNWHPSKSASDLLDPFQVINAHTSVGVMGENIAAPLLGTFVLVVSLVLGYLLLMRRRSEDVLGPGRLIVAGWALVVAGALPFVRYFYSPVGFGDRVTVVSGIGGAAVLVGVIWWSGMRNSVLGGTLALSVVIGALGNRASLVRDYAVAADDSRRILVAVESRWPDGPEEPIVFGPYPVMKRNIVAFIDADWPVQWLYGTDSVSASHTLTAEAFESVPPSQRVDIVELSNLEALDRIEP